MSTSGPLAEAAALYFPGLHGINNNSQMLWSFLTSDNPFDAGAGCAIVVNLIVESVTSHSQRLPLD
jgi:hypothetical protein